MTINDQIAPIRMGGSIGNTVGNIQQWPWDAPNTWLPYQPYQQITYTGQPQFCSGDVHVWGCSHAEACKCGKAKRKVEPPVCPHCKKAHA